MAEVECWQGWRCRGDDGGSLDVSRSGEGDVEGEGQRVRVDWVILLKRMKWWADGWFGLGLDVMGFGFYYLD